MAQATNRLHQLLAVLSGQRKNAENAATAVYHQFQRNTGPMSGLTRTYKPLDEENGDRLPAEDVRVQLRVPDMLATVEKALTELLNTEYTIEDGNTRARANVVVDGQVLMADVPVTFLMQMEKRITDLATMLSKVPTLDPAEVWEWDENSLVWATPESESVRTAKLSHVIVKYPATDKHPAQTELVAQDKVVGHWTKRQFSGALRGDTRAELLRRVDALRQAIQTARSQANDITITHEKELGKRVFDYLFAPLTGRGR